MSIDERQVNILLWHWGRRGAGPKIGLDFLQALHAHPGFRVHYSVSRDAHIYAQFGAVGVPHLDAHTLGSAWRTLRSIAMLPWRAWALFRFIRRHGISVVLSPMWDIWHIALSPIVRASGASHVLCIHDARPHLGEGRVSPLFRFIWRDARSADLVAFFSEFVRREVSRQLGLQAERTLVLPLGPSHFGASIPRPRVAPANPPRILCFGRAYEYKGIDLCIEAMPLVTQAVPEAELLVVGGGDMAPHVAAARRYPQVTVRAGYFPEEKVAEIFAESDVVLSCYREASQSAIVTTAQTMGVPVVCTPVGGLPEQVEDGVTGVISSAVSAEAIAASIIRLLKNLDLYARCAREGQRSILQERSWERSVETLHAVLSETTRKGMKGCK